MLQRLHKRAGFTLVEVLLVLGVMAVLATVSAYSIAGLRRSAEQAHLDAVAQTLYALADSRLKELYSFHYGEVEKLVKSDDHYALLAPGDQTVHYVRMDMPELFETILPPGSFSSSWRGANAKIVVEYLPASASVYSVFYTDAGDVGYDSFYGDAAAAKALRGDRSGRTGTHVGYYSGFSDGELPTGGLPDPEDELVLSLGTLTAGGRHLDNGEELVAKVAVKLPKAGSSSGKQLREAGSLTLTLSVTGQTSGARADFPLPVSGWEDASVFSFDLVLDSLREKQQFKDIFVGTGGERQPLPEARNKYPAGLIVGSASAVYVLGDALIPGESLALTLTADWPDKPADVVPAASQATDNSLFAWDTAGERASIRCGRHLQNLDEATSGVTGYTSAKQNYDIDFEDSAPGKWAAVYPDRKFTPITNGSLRAGSAEDESSASYDGGGHTIRNLRVAVSKDENAGLFGKLGGDADPAKDTMIRDLTLWNVSVTGGAYTGGVLGYATGNLTLIKVCVINPHITGLSTYTGGLAGHAEGSVTVSGCRVYTEKGQAGEEVPPDVNWVVLESVV